MKTIGYAAHSATTPLVPYYFECRALRSNDVAMEVLYCGVCHSDLHTARNDWKSSHYPVVPGHEIVGRVIDMGVDVKRYKIGDHVAVGFLADSCQTCEQCHRGQEQYCLDGFTDTYNGRDRVTGDTTRGGFAKHLVVREEFVLRVPHGLDLTRTAPLLGAGITVYSPLRTWEIGPGSRVGVVGLGGLGHMAVKLAVALGAKVTVMTRKEKKASAAVALGAEQVLVSTDSQVLAQAVSRFDIIIDTIPVKHDIAPYLPLLKVDGTLAIVGQMGALEEFSTIPMLLGRRRIATSLVGGIAQTQELLDFCAKKKILPDCEMIRMDRINDAFDRIETGEIPHRFVIDMKSLPAPLPPLRSSALWLKGRGRRSI
jgi:uncharacterized zinc-type alcohol dehydrogenase-like protein